MRARSSPTEAVRSEGLPDIIGPDCRLLMVGINPGLRSARLGHHFAGHGNQFWPLLSTCGLLPEPLSFHEDRRLLEFGIGLTNLAARPTAGCSDLARREFEAGRAILEAKIRRVAPALVAFVGVVTYRAFFQIRGPVRLGLAPERVGTAAVFVVPNPSGRNAHYSRAERQKAFEALARFFER